MQRLPSHRVGQKGAAVRSPSVRAGTTMSLSCGSAFRSPTRTTRASAPKAVTALMTHCVWSWRRAVSAEADS
eukprot:6480938-Alexandrium_andersonii.AAC.1